MDTDDDDASIGIETDMHDRHKATKGIWAT